MIRNGHVLRGAALLKTPSYRQQATRRRLTVLCGIVALALASGIAGSLGGGPVERLAQVTTGPFSYFPSE